MQTICNTQYTITMIANLKNKQNENWQGCEIYRTIVKAKINYHGLACHLLVSNVTLYNFNGMHFVWQANVEQLTICLVKRMQANGKKNSENLRKNSNEEKCVSKRNRDRERPESQIPNKYWHKTDLK